LASHAVRTIRIGGVTMPGYILTGTPGAGKTAILRLLEVNGHAVVEEAATDAIALSNEEPWYEHTVFFIRNQGLDRAQRPVMPLSTTSRPQWQVSDRPCGHPPPGC
jgi:hypothetical protein